ncbi:hypothetical protein TNCT_157751 [Trichonephila clavata]|uniref:Uncharacterized protein n=1 Tax=Trichonephila clavata TaxID=2740835 RepID=A0A8X6HB86_TRICU|nr:hypothetical protein TNCT_157751 [Trichonephila clavata]
MLESSRSRAAQAEGINSHSGSAQIEFECSKNVTRETNNRGEERREKQWRPESISSTSNTYIYRKRRPMEIKKDKKRSILSSLPVEQKLKRRPQRSNNLYKRKLPFFIPSRPSSKKRTRREVFEKQKDAYRAIPGPSRRTVTVDTRYNRFRQVQPRRGCPYYLQSRRPVPEQSEQTKRRSQSYPRCSKETHIQGVYAESKVPSVGE